MSDTLLQNIYFVLTFVLFFAISFFPQLWLCFKEKNLIIRLLPVALLFWTAVFFVAVVFSMGWMGGYFLYPAIYSIFMLLMCGLAWGVWGIVKLVKYAKEKKHNNQID